MSVVGDVLPERVDLTLYGTITQIDGPLIKLDLSATSAGVKVLAMAKAVILNPNR